MDKKTIEELKEEFKKLEQDAKDLRIYIECRKCGSLCFTLLEHFRCAHTF